MLVRPASMVQEVHQLIDSHAHLEELEGLERALEKARSLGMVAVIAVGSNHQSNVETLEISERHPAFVYPALGLHPWALAEMGASEIDGSLRFIEDNMEKAVAIGEIGLDYHKRLRAAVDKDRQQAVLKDALRLAQKYDKPVILHCRYAWKDCFDLVHQMGVKKAVFHWYTGFTSVLREIVALGYLVSATPAAEYHGEHRRAIREAPLASLLLETDSPVEYGRETRYRSQPADIVRSLGAVAELKGIDESTVARKTTLNAAGLFGLPVDQGLAL